MARMQPGEPPKLQRGQLDRVMQTRTYRLITPLFGGGPQTQQADPVTVVRATEIRGQLRFWWRALRGGQYGDDLEQLRVREGEIWGTAAKFDDQQRTIGGPSPIQVCVTEWQHGTEDVPYVVEGGRNNPRLKPRDGTAVPAYAAFPLQPKREDQYPDMPIQPVREGVAFTLELEFPKEYRLELEAALWAWETFGGLGARTRRGFGALRLVSVDGTPVTDLPGATAKAARQWIARKLQLHSHVTAETWPTSLPHVSPQVTFRLVETDGDAEDAWMDLIQALRTFRQRRRDKEGRLKEIGHSDWPEPNAIRDQFRLAPKGPNARRLIRSFPRAQFGLPIVFHMPHDPGLDVTLQGAEPGRTRHASPLILKPLACQNNAAIGLALILEGSQLSQEYVLHGSPSDEAVRVDLTQTEASRLPYMAGQTDVLQAFLKSLPEE